MNDFSKCDSLGSEGVHQVVQFIRGRSGVCFDTNHFPEHVRYLLQTNLGDLLVQKATGETFTIEVKTEERDEYGNFFVESWSNGVYGRQTVGWAYTSKATYLAYVFLRDKRLYMLDMRRLWTWLFKEGAYRNYPEKPQKKNSQLNQTFGWCIPIADVRKHVGMKDWIIETNNTVIQTGAA